MGKVMAICISEIRGVQKKNVHTARLIENWGVEHDAHAGNWHRQVSLLSYETIQDFNRQGAGVIDGARFRCGDVVLELTQIGKECHNGCEIFKKMGKCIMPTNGVFTKVIHGGVISEGDAFEVIGKGEN